LGQTTHLTATVTAGENVAYEWALGDGSSGSQAHVSHQYPAAGLYQAIVTATNAVSVMTATTQIVVGEPVAGLDAINDSPTALGEATHLTATVTGGSFVEYTWDLGAGGATQYGAQVAHTYPAPGAYAATVTAHNALSELTATTRVTITGVTFEGAPLFGSAPLTHVC
jgi:PKD repeat protein